MRSFSPVFGDTVDGASALAEAPFNRSSGQQTLSLTTSDALISLAAGYYVFFSDASTDTTVLRTGGSTADFPPASGAAEDVGCITYPAGGGVSVLLDRSLTLHARVLSGTATLRIARKSV